MRKHSSLVFLQAKIQAERIAEESVIALAGPVPQGDPDVYLRLQRSQNTAHNVTMIEESDRIAMGTVTTPPGYSVTDHLNATREHAFAMCTGMGGLA